MTRGSIKHSEADVYDGESEHEDSNEGVGATEEATTAEGDQESYESYDSENRESSGSNIVPKDYFKNDFDTVATGEDDYVRLSPRDGSFEEEGVKESLWGKSQPRQRPPLRTMSWTKEMAMKSNLLKRIKKTKDGRPILPDHPLKGPDTLTSHTRNYYESTKSKMAASLILGAFSMTLFGLCAVAGGKGEALYSTGLAYGDVDASLWYNETSGNHTTIYTTEVIELAFDGQDYKDLDEERLLTFAQAFGFACFCYLVAAVLVIVAAVRISPLFCGATGDYAAITKFDNWEENMYFFGIPTQGFSTLAHAKKEDAYLGLDPTDKTGTCGTDQVDEEAPVA